MCRYSVFGRLVVDSGPENKGLAEVFAKKYRIQRIQISVYNSKVNGMIKRGHRSITDTLAKMSDKKES